MVARSPTGSVKPVKMSGFGSATMGRVGAAAARFLGLLPALLFALLCLRLAELGAGTSAGATSPAAARVVARALAEDVFALMRHLPLLFLLSLPPLLVRSRRGVFWGLGLTWSVLIAAQAALVEYFIVSRVPLGADLFAYSLREINATVSAGLRLDPVIVAGTLLALLGLWSALARLLQRERPPLSPRATALVFALGLAALVFGPEQLPQAHSETEDARNLRLNKAAYFFDDSVAYLIRSPATQAPRSEAPGGAATPGPIIGFRYLDPSYPFLHAEQTPDELGAHFLVHQGSPPNLVFLIIEGLGRSFSGPDARLGSFTPFLDQLAERSLYWENFLAVQGRTFAVLPSIFGSLPFGDDGFNTLDDAMPAHATLLSVLKSQGYRLHFYTGADLKFDNERAFLQRQGMDALLERKDFGPGYTRSNDWGYADNELVSLALADEVRDPWQPFVTILQTITTHTPYTFPDQKHYQRLFEQRLDQLGVAERQKDDYRAYRDIYSSVMYVDAALRRYFEQARQRPSYGNTIFIVTGDHRLPEIPMSEWIDRYHVPLIIFSPLLRAPLRIKSVSSDFDITPSLLAFLSHGYGIQTPAAVTWVGSGLDLEPSFRNVHEFPMKQTKTNLVDFVAGPWLLSRDALYSLSDGMHMEPAQDAVARARVEARFAAFRAANSQFARSLTLMPPGNTSRLAAYADQERRPPQAVLTPTVALAVREVLAPERARAGQLAIDVVFANAAAEPSAQFVPLIVLLSPDGQEVSESYGAPVTLAAGAAITLRLPVKSDGVAAGRYFLSVLPSNPETGRRSGTGRYHIPIVIDG
jgi:hypothetical protein